MRDGALPVGMHGPSCSALLLSGIPEATALAPPQGRGRCTTDVWPDMPPPPGPAPPPPPLPPPRLSVCRQPVLSKYLTLKEGEAILRRPFVSPVPGAPAQSDVSVCGWVGDVS